MKSRKPLLVCAALLLFLPALCEGQSEAGGQLMYTADTAAIMRQIVLAKELSPREPDKAMGLLLRAQDESRKAMYLQGLLKAKVALGKTYIHKGLYKEAQRTFAEARLLCRADASGEEELAEICNGLAQIAHIRGDYEQAMTYLLQAAAVAEKIPLPSLLGKVYCNMATVLLQVGKEDESMYYLDKGEQIARQEKDYEILGSILISKGIIYSNRKRTDSAERMYRTAMQIGTEHGIGGVTHISMTNLGHVYLERDSPQAALPLLLGTKALQGNITRFNRNVALRLLGDAYFRLHDYDKAEQCLQDALKTARQLHIGNDLLMIHQTLAQVAAARGRYQEAYRYQTIYTKLKDSFENSESRKNMNLLEVKYRTAEKDKSIIANRLLITRQQARIMKNKVWLWNITGGFLVLVFIFILFYRYKQKLQAERFSTLEKEKEIRAMQSMIYGEEKERSRLARELHDGIGGMLASLKMNFSSLEKKHRELMYAPDYQETMQILDDTMNEVRRTAHNLMPELILRYGLVEALRIFCSRLQKGQHIAIDFQCLGTVSLGNGNVALTLYRMIQELLHNIVKHASATRALLQISQHDGMLHIILEDNGIGIRPGDGDSNGIGLANMQSRIAALDGRMSIDSIPGTGTSIYIELDVSKTDKITV